MTRIKYVHIYHQYLLSNDAKKVLSALDEIESLEEAEYGLFAWQARLLQMQWKEIEPGNPRAEDLKQEITRVLGY